MTLRDRIVEIMDTAIAATVAACESDLHARLDALRAPLVGPEPEPAPAPSRGRNGRRKGSGAATPRYGKHPVVRAKRVDCKGGCGLKAASRDGLCRACKRLVKAGGTLPRDVDPPSPE